MACKDITEQQLKNYIKSIITANPTVSTIQSLQKEYHEFIGTSIPYHKFGYNSVEHLLKSIPDTCKVQGTGPFAQVTPTLSEKSAHINLMVMQQKVNTKGRKRPPRRRNTRCSVPTTRRSLAWHPTYNYSFSPNTSLSSSSSLDYSSSHSQSKTTNTNRINLNTGIKKASDAPNNNTSMKNTNCQTYIAGRRTENTEEKTNYILKQNQIESQKVKQHLDSLIEQQIKLGNVSHPPTTSSPSGQETEVLNNSKKINSRPDNPPVLERNGLWDLHFNKSDYAQESSKETSVNNEDANFNRSKEVLENLLCNFKSEEEDEDTSNVPKRVQSNLRTLISQFCNGIWCSDLPDHYKRLFNKDLMFMEYGYTSLIEMCIALKHIFHYVRPGVDDFKLYDRHKPLPENVEKLYTMASYDTKEKKIATAEALPDLDWTDFKGHIPDDIFQYGNEIPREFLASGTKLESVLDVVVVEIYDPSKFWIYLGTSDNNTPLDELMDDIQTFYNQQENAKEYAIPSGALREGLYCVQVIFGEYHRGRIVQVLPESPDFVRIFYIDYGTTCKTSVKGICFLHAKFAELNAQAIRCRLANIVPNLKGHPWPRSTSDRFRDLVNRRDTRIKISYIDWNDEYVCVFLADVTDNDNIVYINETLVKEDHALWDGENQVVPFVLCNFKCKVQNIHLFPTFGELEYGLAPNAGEMYSLSEMLVPLQFCIPQYFTRDEQIFSSDDESELEQMENTFVETVKNHRKFAPLSKIDINGLINPPPIDFDIFGDLKEDMREFCMGLNTGEDVENEDELYCDIKEETANNLEHYKTIERNLEEFEPLRLIKEDRELSGSIIEKLERYSMLGSEHSSSSEAEVESVISHNFSTISYKSEEDLEFGEDLMIPTEVADSELSTIFEQSEIELDNSKVPSPKHGIFRRGLDITDSSSDRNIFDNPEEFDTTSDVSEKSENASGPLSPEPFLGKTSDASEKSDRPASPESFLRTIERLSRKDLEEESDLLEDSNSVTEVSPVVGPDSEKPFKFDINADLREAFKSFLKSQKLKSADSASTSSCEQSSSRSIQYEEQRYFQSNNYVESFLKCSGQSSKFEEVRAVNETIDLATRDKFKTNQSDLDVPSRNNVEDTRNNFISTLSLNNPFRTYLEKSEVMSGNDTDYLTTSGTEDKNMNETTTPVSSEPSLGRELLELKIKQKDDEYTSLSAKTSDSEGSDYKVFVPRSGQTQSSNVLSQESQSAQVQGFVGTNGIGVNMPPMKTDTPPKLFTPPGFVPAGFGPYPQWSNGSGFPVPQYPQWSMGPNYPTPYPNYSRPREMLRPPPGFSYQGPPQNFNPYMASPVPGPSVYPPSGVPFYPPPPRQMMVPSPECDFYESYNKLILKKSQKPS